MKKLQLIIACLTIFTAINAQQLPYPVGSYISGPDLDKFVGTWKYMGGNKSFTIVLEKQVVTSPPPTNWQFENIIGWHEYIENGVTTESSLIFVGQSFDSAKWTIFGQNKTRNNGLTLTGSIFDITKNKTCSIELSMTNANNTQISMVI